MEHTSFQKGKFYSLPIVDKVKEGNKTFFIVKANGNKYPIRMFDFQKDDPEVNALTDLPCMVKECFGDHIVFVQNFAVMFDHLFEEDESYSFLVVRNLPVGQDGNRYYDVRDSHGVPFRIKTDRDIILRPQQKISCRVRKPSRNKLSLEYEPGTPQTDSECKSPEEFLNECEIDPGIGRLFKRALTSSEYFAEARDFLSRGDAEWIVKAITALPGVDKWSGIDDLNKGNFRIDTIQYILEEFRKLSLHILEESLFLWSFTDSEREFFQERIAEKLEECECWTACLDLISRKSEGDEVKSILGKIEKTGYLFRPQQKMMLLIAIFSLKPRLLEDNIDNILSIVDKYIKGRNLDSFRRAFVDFMKFYITSNRETVDRAAFADDPHSRLLVDRMVKAIYHTLLLSEEEARIPLYRSMLYHYLSFVRDTKNDTAVDSSDTSFPLSMINRAFKAIMGADADKMQAVPGLETGETNLFAHLLADRQKQDDTFSTRSFESGEIRLSISNEGITIAPAVSSGKEKEVLKKTLPWQNIAVYLDNSSRHYIEPRSRLPRWREWWKKVEAELLRPVKKKTPVKVRTIAPGIGTEVCVRVLRQEKGMPNRYFCRIEEPGYHGEGWLDTYNKGGSTALFHYDPGFDIESFYYQGAPMKLKVKVNSRKPDENDSDKEVYNFAAMQLIDQFVQENIQYEEEADCRIIFHDERCHVYFGVTEHGYGVFMPELNEDLDFAYSDTFDECKVRVRITDTSRPGQIQAEVIGRPEKDFTVKEAAENLLFSYCNGEYYEETEEELDEEAMSASEDSFETSELSQLISLLDHVALLEDNNVTSYGYLSLAHIIARMIGDSTLMDYLDERRRLLCVLDNFGNNGKVDDSELVRLSSANSDMIDKFPILKERLCELEIVGSMGKQEKNSYLWYLTESYHPSQKIGKLSRLMLAYNMADSFGMQEQQAEVVSKIKSLLNVNIELPKIYSFGEEGQLTEFKSSLVYPPDHGMMPDLTKQTFNILRVINGMANSYGGNLYLGVYDTGTAKGLEDDLAYREFANNRDKFDRYVRNSIRETMGDRLNAKIAIEYPEAGGKFVYLIKVPSMKDPVPMKWKDQIYYFMRQGSSTYAYTDSQRSKIETLMADRDLSLYSKTPERESVDDSISDLFSLSQEKTRNKGLDIPDSIPTGRLRQNITESWREGYGKETAAYLRIHKVGEWSLMDDVAWEEGLLTLAIGERERDGHLVTVYPDGEVVKASIPKLLNKEYDVRHKMQSGKRPVFVCPASKGSALLFVYTDARKRRFIRLDSLSDIPEVNIHERGTKLTDAEIASVRCCEVIPEEMLENLRSFMGLKTSHPGVQYTTGYINKDFDYLRGLGIDIEI